MSSPSRLLALSALALGLALGLSGRPSLGAPAAPTQEPIRPRPASFEGVPVVPLGELREERGRWLGRRVRLIVQFDERVEAWNPYVSRFGPRDWSCLRAWADEDFLWNLEAYEDPAPRLFVRRDEGPDRALRLARRHERYALEGIVREVFLDEPWIEVTAARRLPTWVGEGTLLHAARALELTEEGRYSLAAGELERALAGRLPEHVKAELLRLKALCAEAPPDGRGGAPNRRRGGN